MAPQRRSCRALASGLGSDLVSGFASGAGVPGVALAALASVALAAREAGFGFVPKDRLTIGLAGRRTGRRARAVPAGDRFPANILLWSVLGASTLTSDSSCHIY